MLSDYLQEQFDMDYQYVLFHNILISISMFRLEQQIFSPKFVKSMETVYNVVEAITSKIISLN